MGLKRYKNLTWQTKGRHDQCTNYPRARRTEATTLLQHPPPYGLTWRPLSNPRQVSSGTELDNQTNQDSKPPMIFLTAETRNLAIARSLCQYSGPFWYVFKNSATCWREMLSFPRRRSPRVKSSSFGPSFAPFLIPDSIQGHQLLTRNAVFSKKEVTSGQIVLLRTQFRPISPLPTAFNDINCWREMLSFSRRRSPRSKSASSGLSFAPFLPCGQHATTSSSRIYEKRTIGLLEPTHLKLTQLK